MKQVTIEPGWHCEPGTLVSIRPCDDKYEEKTFLGIFIGDLSAFPCDENGKRNSDKPYMHNPCIWVPDLKEYIFGFESWWGTIDSKKDLHQITNQDIENVWYVKALQQFEAKEEK